MNGLKHIAAAFEQAKSESRAALMPYLTLGYPTPEISLRVIESTAANGADLIELGVPFSDPLADGPTIQHSTQVAIEQGVTGKSCFEMVRTLRSRGVNLPLFLMGYVNPIFAYGIEKYTQEAQQSGADGLIVPDLPPEEAGPLQAACLEKGLALVFLLSPASPLERVKKVAALTSGFLCLVSLTGVTGARTDLPNDLPAFVDRAKAVAHTPVAVGFGISTPTQAATVGKLADGVIVGSALINTITAASDPVQAAGEFVRSLRSGFSPIGKSPNPTL